MLQHPLVHVCWQKAPHRERHQSAKSWGCGGKAPAGCAGDPAFLLKHGRPLIMHYGLFDDASTPEGTPASRPVACPKTEPTLKSLPEVTVALVFSPPRRPATLLIQHHFVTLQANFPRKPEPLAANSNFSRHRPGWWIKATLTTRWEATLTPVPLQSPVLKWIRYPFGKRTLGRRPTIYTMFFDGNGTLAPALETNRACAVTRPSKQDSASGRSDSSSAIQSRKYDQNGTRYREVVQ
jgi:hypothetical protein